MTSSAGGLQSERGRSPDAVRPVRASYMQLAQHLRDMIVSGQLPPGHRLPSEADMAPMFGVSRTTVREALRILATDGLVTTKRGVHGGTFVTEVGADRIESLLSDAFDILALTERVSSSDFLDAWSALEVPAARLAAARRDGDSLATLEEACSPMPAGSDGGGQLWRIRTSQNFHFAVLQGSGNLLLEAMGRPVSVVARRRFSQTAPTERFWKRNLEEHRLIFQAIAAGDEDSAGEEMARHIASLRSYYAREAARTRRRASTSRARSQRPARSPQPQRTSRS